jgi:hypothetical protein
MCDLLLCYYTSNMHIIVYYTLSILFFRHEPDEILAMKRQ